VALVVGNIRFRAPFPEEHAMNNKKLKTLRKRRGQGMTEYIIIVALIAIAAIGVITLCGNNIRRLFGASADALAGETNVANEGKMAGDNIKTKKLKSFGQNNEEQ
jgi:pilus assembly protein Flp/PilA